jgi:photosystem II stability/assembly factor-like uncharacterized protein
MTTLRRRRFLVSGGVAAAVCVACLVVAAGALAAAGWVAQSLGTTAPLGGVAFAGPGAGWAVGAGGIIRATSDGGATWGEQISSVTDDLSAVAFAGAQDGWAVGANGAITATTDGGATWIAQTSAVTSADLTGVAFADAQNGWAVGAGGVILTTANGGTTWTTQSSGVNTDLNAVAFVSAGEGWAVGAKGVILTTTDGGAHWIAQTSAVTSADLTGVAFADAQNGWAVGAGGVIVTTSNGGTTWTTQTSHTDADLRGVAFANAGDGWAVGAGGVIVATTDGGVTWATQTSGVSADLAAVAFANDRHGLVVGASGTVLEAFSAGIPDVTKPVTTATGLQADGHTGWRNTAQQVTFKSSDTGSGVAATYYAIGTGTVKTYTGPFTIATAGSHAVSYWSVDAAGNIEAGHTAYVNIDTGRPRCVAVANVEATPGSLVKLAFRVNDPAPSCGRAVVTIRIYRGRVVAKTIRLKAFTVKKRHVYAYRVKLRRGSYTWVVTAKDLAGNVQIKKGRRSLRVVNWVIHNTADVQRCLASLHYLPQGAVSGVDDYRTQQALMAFQAWSGLARDGIDGHTTRARLEVAAPPKPRSESATGNYAEVFRSLGVLLCVSNGKLVRVVHCSTGRPSLPTPAGHFSIYLKSLDWWSTKYLDWMPFASFFSGGDAIHGFPDVPAYPASHGCVRISMPEAPWVYTFMYYGAQVYVY